MEQTRYEAHYGRMVRCFAERPANVDALFKHALALRPDADAVVLGEERLSYREADDRVGRISANLALRGIRKGDRIALILGNRPEFLLMILAAARFGAIVVPVNPRQRRPEIAFMLNQSGAVLLVCEAALADELPEPADVARLMGRLFVGGAVAPEISFGALLQDATSAVFPEVAEDDPLCILYTSGTTGQPKGAMLTHLGLIHSVLHFGQGLGLRQGDVAALAVPASHVTGLVAILLATIGVAGTSVMMADFKAAAFLNLVERERVSYTLMVPAMYNLCLMQPDLASRDLSSWRVGGFGGAPMPQISIERLADAIPGLKLSNIYGATETTSPATLLPAGDIASHRDSVGLVLPCADILVVDEQGHEVPPGAVGELLIAGPMTIPAYWENPLANSQSFVGGYWRSGDLGSRDADGYVRIHDRKKDVINRGGYKIYCAEVENVLLGYPGVGECAVVGYPDAVLGERVAAFLWGEAGIETGPLREYCAGQLADYKLPEMIVALDDRLPRNSNGKILKNVLRQLAGTGRQP